MEGDVERLKVQLRFAEATARALDRNIKNPPPGADIDELQNKLQAEKDQIAGMKKELDNLS